MISLSRSVSGKPAQLSATKGLARRGMARRAELLAGGSYLGLTVQEAR
jgi:hypothetical protein